MRRSLCKEMHYFCNAFTAVSMENKYYSSWILTLGYADVLYTVVENYIIVDEALYRVYDDGTLEKTRKEEAGILLPDEMIIP